MSRYALLWGGCLSALSIAGCGSSPPVTGEDASMGGVDSGSPPVDDADGDGIPTARDCDDSAAGVGTTDARACAGPCGDGLERCFEGVWMECEASRECLCTTPGETRVAVCGRCGMQSERCGDTGRWEAQTACQMQGECMPGEVDDDGNDRCLSRQRICTDSCEWGEWTVLRPEGECRAGETRNVRYPLCEIRTQVCDAECHWAPETVLIPAGECEGPGYCPVYGGSLFYWREPFPDTHGCSDDCRIVHCPDDVDGDGILDMYDCDTADVTVGYQRSCETSCGSGTTSAGEQFCMGDPPAWSECQAQCTPGQVSRCHEVGIRFPLAFRCTESCERVPCS